MKFDGFCDLHLLFELSSGALLHIAFQTSVFVVLNSDIDSHTHTQSLFLGTLSGVILKCAH